MVTIGFTCPEPHIWEVDKTSRAALIEGGTYGPALEAQLRPHSLTLRHFPQSFEYSTLGGWIATRAGGHFATLVALWLMARS
jgi:alkyldihydroxyacetonephosphate synthase